MSSTASKPKAILFDLLTALLDSWTLWNECAGSEEQGRQWRAQYLKSTFSCGNYKPYPDMVKQAAIDSNTDVTCAERLLADWDRLQPWPEVRETLRKLKEEGYRIGVVTNCSQDLGVRAAGRVGVDFDVVTTAEEIGFYKPVKQVYLEAVRKLNCEVDEVLFVAGSSGDVGGADAAGLKVVWNNHVGLQAASAIKPLREGSNLNEALADFL